MDSKDYPIDIHSGKLLEWLLSRHHCPKNWPETISEIRKKINQAIVDMPEVEEIKELLMGNYINYFHCCRIVELLKDTESETKNIFGQYSSQRMKDWKDIVRLYEKDGVYLADSAQLLIRTVSYEIPALKKQIEKCVKNQSECSRKEREYANNANENIAKYNQTCKQFGIKGECVKKELVELASDLPHYLDRCSEEMKELKDALQLYKEFTVYSLKREEGEECCPMLAVLIKSGNISVYEELHGRVPDRIEDPFALLSAEENDTTEAAEAEIDWGGGDDAIDFDISVEGEEECEGSGITVESVDGVARGDEARSLLDSATHRTKVLNDLLELAAFLTRYVEERAADEEGGSVLAQNFFQAAPASIQAVGHMEGVAMLKKVQHVIDKLTNKTTGHLLLIRSSPRYVDRLVSEVGGLWSRVERCRQLQRLMEIRREEASQEHTDLLPRLDHVRGNCLTLKGQMENAISKKYNSRRVNIMGEISTI